ncbi:palmitoyltransferase [Chloropicon primus]|uniref:S-acyltransferase n=1 Tax=Chloropicon primus TaxID=1764295 RepID=A0A5B8MHG9_9CHLO|nr:palmitoyltransferase [Chloropicon primus]UPQ98746.1 palmitoyltransferase [Chloropicon primus]|eukprot:QDZ19534.1 palmitoyltransferase [Chloropicon primus]
MLLDEIKRNPGPFALWSTLHLVITLWLFLNRDCSLCQDVSKERGVVRPFLTASLIALNTALYLKTLQSSPEVWRQPDDVALSSFSGEDKQQEGGQARPGDPSWELPGESEDDPLQASRGRGSSSSFSARRQPDLEVGDLALPLRTKYCKRCEAYVLRHDHHCPFLGGCIGLGNHRTFYLFLLAQNVLCAYAGGLNSQCFVSRQAQGDWVVANGLPILVALVITATLLVLAPLFAFHTYLVLANVTTYEVLAREKIWYLEAYPPGVNPFDRGAWQNLRSFFCQSLESSIPTRLELEEARARETIWDNRYYSCCG